MAFRKNVFILGAGFSAGAGAPLMAHFLDQARQLWEDPRSPLSDIERNNIFRSVFDYRFQLDITKAKFEIDLDNIEDLFGLVEMQCQLATKNVDYALTARRNILYLIVKTLELCIVRRPNTHIQFSLSESDGSLRVLSYPGDVYNHFIRLVTRSCVEQSDRNGGFCKESIISLNYDLILDHTMETLNIKPTYGLEGCEQVVDERSQREWDSSMYILKLHGSSNWMICRSCSTFILVSREKVTEAIRNVFAQPCLRCGTQTLEPFIIPPTWNKGGSNIITQRVWQKALSELKEAQRIFIIGYSVPPSDRFFDYLLGAALAENRGLYEVIIVNADHGSEARYKQIFSRDFWERYVHFSHFKNEDFISRGHLQQTMRHGLVRHP